MSATSYTPFILELSSIIDGASTPDEAWQAVLARLDAIAVVTPGFAPGDIKRDVAVVADQIRRMMAASPPPDDPKLLYFGLFTGADPDTFTELAGYYVVGSTRETSPMTSAAELAEGAIDYAPDDRYLESPLLQRIKAAALTNPANYDRYDYALMLGAAAVLSRFALRQLGVRCRVVVGFDSGDAIELSP